MFIVITITVEGMVKVSASMMAKLPLFFNRKVLYLGCVFITDQFNDGLN